ncbi:hypothetical protein [Staphylococcus capitis]|uniref:Phage protein n=1 Tax=Staphylococcus capitis TaxID=29388 RepID=A0ABX1SNT1_STACP|nr:hypothetical protein [Staphylococcus capitis]NMK53959.1 hypothetical protein [Staphylococcus capitis]NMK69348.1 hypothetical protein [Staphylococcus capitis]
MANQNNKNLPKHPYLYFSEGTFKVHLLSGKTIVGKLIGNFQFDILIEAKAKNKNGEIVPTEMIIAKHAIEYASRIKKDN